MASKDSAPVFILAVVVTVTFSMRQRFADLMGFQVDPTVNPLDPLGLLDNMELLPVWDEPNKKPADTEQRSKAGHGETAKLRWVSERCNVTF